MTNKVQFNDNLENQLLKALGSYQCHGAMKAAGSVFSGAVLLGNYSSSAQLASAILLIHVVVAETLEGSYLPLGPR